MENVRLSEDWGGRGGRKIRISDFELRILDCGLIENVRFRVADCGIADCGLRVRRVADFGLWVADFGLRNVIRWYGLMAIAGMDNVPLRGFLFPRFRGSSLRSERHEGREAGGSYRGRRASGDRGQKNVRLSVNSKQKSEFRIQNQKPEQ
jgi:hypothetical protein